MISKVLKTMRRKANMSQEDVSKKCNVAKSTLSGYENAYREPTFKVIESIANICGYEIQFVNKKTNEILTTKNINRKEI